MRRYRSYKFTNKKHSQGGVCSSIAGVISVICTAMGIYGAYAAKGNAGTYLALLGVLAIGACVYGVIVGNQSLKDEECYHVFSKIGTGLNLVLVLFWIAVFGMGFLV